VARVGDRRAVRETSAERACGVCFAVASGT
jgi:hypothetical protein